MKIPQLSVMLYIEGTIENMREQAQRCVDAGVKNIYIPDHLTGGGISQGKTTPWLDAWPAMMDLAFRYPEITTGPLVASQLLRPAAELASLASTTAHIIGTEHFILSLGAGATNTDLPHIGDPLSLEEVSSRFSEYVAKIDAYRKGTHAPALRLPSDFTLRVASDSIHTIDLVSRHGDAWVTTGGFKKTLEQRVTKVNELSAMLNNQKFKGPIAVLMERSDGITLESTESQIQNYTARYNCDIDEIILPVLNK